MSVDFIHPNPHILWARSHAQHIRLSIRIGLLMCADVSNNRHANETQEINIFVPLQASSLLQQDITQNSRHSTLQVSLQKLVLQLPTYLPMPRPASC